MERANITVSGEPSINLCFLFIFLSPNLPDHLLHLSREEEFERPVGGR
jgi:hypothetical protein